MGPRLSPSDNEIPRRPHLPTTVRLDAPEQKAHMLAAKEGSAAELGQLARM